MNPSILSPYAQVQVTPTGVPVGTVIAYAGPVDGANGQALTAQGWLVCDGSQVLVSAYPVLASLLGNAYGNQQDGQFYLPDYRGVFLRGVNGDRQSPNDPGAANRTGSGPDGQGNTGNAVGSLQTAQFQEHEHQYTAGTVTANFQAGGAPAVTSAVESTTTSVVCEAGDTSSTSCFGAETRPLNLYVYFLIKATPDALAVAVPSMVGGLSPRGGGLFR
ncbi:MAG: phage tail protein [Acidobacteriota bacterium]